MRAVSWKIIDARTTLFWGLQISGWAAYGLYRWFSDPRFFPRGFVYLLVGFSLTSALHPLYKRVWGGSPTFLLVSSISVLCSVAAGFLYLLIAKFLFVSVGAGTYQGLPWHAHLVEAFRNSFVHNKTFVFLSWSALYFGIKYWRDVAAQKERADRADVMAHEAQMEMLRYQLNPHFLFNSLNSIHALVREDPRRAEKMLDELSDFLRYSLLHNRVFETSLKEEFDVARGYLDIEKIRFEELLEIRCELNPAVAEFRVPSFIIHPLLENAIKYGMQTSPMPLRVEATAERDDGAGAVRIKVANTGAWVRPGTSGEHAPSGGTGIGLKNVRRRLETAFPERHAMEVFERGGWVYAVVEIFGGARG